MDSVLFVVKGASAKSNVVVSTMDPGVKVNTTKYA